MLLNNEACHTLCKESGVKTIYETELTDVRQLCIRASEADVVTWQERRALRLNGLVLIPDLSLADASIEVEIGTEGAAYPGIVFRAADTMNYELAYAQPHTSGQWDAIQYDPVFHGSNTWQLYHGDNYQHEADIPLNQWFTLRVDFACDRAAIRVNRQPPLVVPRLAHSQHQGLIGIWTYLPAYFRNLRVMDCDFPASAALPSEVEPAPTTVTEWFLDGYGAVTCEPHGSLNVNRYVPLSAGEVQLSRRFETAVDGEVEIHFGFSDKLALKLDGNVIYEGHHLYHSSPKWEHRGYVAPERCLKPWVRAGAHQLVANLKVSEYFGWGMNLSLSGQQVLLLPAMLG
jgi:hypothetical protein